MGRVVDSDADRDVIETDCCMAKFRPGEDVGEEVDLDLDVILRSQPGEMATNEHIEVDSCSL